MKNYVGILLLILFISCSNDEDSPNNNLNGDWTLIKIDCYCGFDAAINFNDFTLRFEDSRNVVHLDNPTEDYFYISSSGSYNYTLEGNTIKISGAEPYNYDFRDSKLILTRIDDPMIADDELILTYERQN